MLKETVKRVLYPHRVRKIIKRVFDLHDIRDLVVGAHCGLCGAWMPDEIIEKIWTWGMCDKCAEVKNEN